MYDSNGLRISKTYNGTETTYYRDNGNLIREIRSGIDIWYVYDDQGNIIGIDYNGVRYYYLTDALSNVIKLINTAGTVVVTYNYNSWGKILSTSGSLASTVGANNPFRYRSYYYDIDVGTYYLISRYYDPDTGRFISPDNPEVVLQASSEHGIGNLYAYCFNDPVNATDPDGNMPNWLKWTLGVTIIVAAVALSVATAGLAAPIAAGVGGGLCGAIVGGAVAGAIGGAVAGFGISVGIQGVSKDFENIDWNKVGKDTAIGAISGAVTGGAFGALKYVTQGGKIVANGISGLKNAQANFDKAALTLKNTQIACKGGVMATSRIVAQRGYDVASAGLGFAKSTYNIALFSYKAIEYGSKLGSNMLCKYLINGGY